MTEQEIINTLKENKTKGIAYLFLPEDVREWISEDFNNPKLMYLAPNGKWEFFHETDFDDCDNVVFALPDYYKVKQELSGEWVEFEINEGKFRFISSDVNGLDGVIKSWWNWQEFLTVSSKYNLGYTTFGGWQYENDNRWYLAPAIKLNTDNCYWNSYTSEKEEVKPAIPVKIRFWREKQ